jgi:hypothetical protein
MDLFLSKKYFRGRTRVDGFKLSSKHVMKQVVAKQISKEESVW